MHSEFFEMFTLPTFLLILMMNVDIVQATGLLASSLFRFRETICDSKMLHIHCPEGSVISIQFSQYGYSASDYHTCTSITTYFGEQLRMARDTDCFVSNALEVLLRICQDKRRCQLEASIETFTRNADPCPNKTKYLEVAYQCRPTEFHKKLACENENLSLKCRRSNRIVVYSAMLRHFPWNKTLCPKIKPETLFNCKTPQIAEEAVKECQGRKHCTANVASRLFGELCPHDSQKYLEVVYTCVPKRILRNSAHDHKSKKVTPHSHPKKSKGQSHKDEEDKEPRITGQSWQPEVRGQQDPAIVQHFQVENKMTTAMTTTTSTTTTTTTPLPTTTTSTTTSTTTTTTPLPTTTTPITTTTTTTTTTPSSKTVAPVVIYSPTPSTPEFRADIAQLNPLPNIPKPRPGGTIREVGGGNSGSDSSPIPTESNSQWTLHCINKTTTGKIKKEKAMNIVADWLGLFYLFRKNREKAMLYFILGVCVGTICLLLAIIIRLIVVNRRKAQAKLDLTEPTHSQHTTPMRNNHVGNSSPSLRRATSDEFIDFVGFGPRTATLRTDPGNRSLNYF